MISSLRRATTELIADLDAALERRGEDITLARGSAAVGCRAFMRKYTPKELIEGSGLQEGDSAVVLSPTDLAGWSGVEPRRNDRVTAGGRAHAVISAAPVRVAGTVVRFNLTVRG